MRLRKDNVCPEPNLQREQTLSNNQIIINPFSGLGADKTTRNVQIDFKSTQFAYVKPSI